MLVTGPSRSARMVAPELRFLKKLVSGLGAIESCLGKLSGTLERIERLLGDEEVQDPKKNKKKKSRKKRHLQLVVSRP